MSTPYAFDYGIDFTGIVGEIATAEIKLSNGETIKNTTDGVVEVSGTITAALKDITMSLGSDADGDIYYRTGNKLTRLGKGTEGHYLKQGAAIPEWAAGGAGYTNLTSFVEQTAFRVFYSDTAGDVTELALGTDGQYLMSNGADQNPSWATPAGTGDVVVSGTPENSQVAVWTDATHIEGAATLTYDGFNLQLTGDIGATGARITKGWFANLEITGDLTVNGTALASIYAAIAQNMYIGTTQVAINRSSAALTLAGITLTTPNIGAATMGGNLTASDYHITGLGRVSFTQELDNGEKTENFSVDFATDQKQKCTLTANTITLTLDTTSVGVGNYLLKIVNGGLATLTWASESGAIYFPSGTDPSLTSSGTDIVTFYFDGTNWYGASLLDFS